MSPRDERPADGAETGAARGATVLVVDDELAIRQALRLVLEEGGYDVIEAPDGHEGVRKALAHRPDAVLLDIRMPRLDGLQALRRIHAALPEAPVLIISGHGTIETAVEALRQGAEDFLEKPLQEEVVLRRLARALRRRQLEQRVEALQEEDEERWRLVGDGPAMKAVRRMIERAGPTQATVLITGESGTGKELVARAIHRASRRRDRPFVKVNCAAIPDELIESELFGHERGAFTGAATRQIGRFVRAHRGTIFLDEIGDMSVKTQAKVLRALQEGEVEPLGAEGPIRVDVRVIAATNRDLREEIAAGRFREDLYYRLNVLPIRLPPLRERREDIPALVEHFTRLICRENNFKPRRFTPQALAVLSARDWPGNVRELRNLLERVIILAPGDTIDAADIPGADARSGSEDGSLFEAETLREFKERAERAFLLRKLEEHDWNITRTAQAIGTPRSNLYKKLEHHELERLAQPRRSEGR